MKVVLVNPPDELEAMFGVGKAFIQKYEPLGLLYIAAVARDRGHDVVVIDAYAEELDIGEVQRRIAEEAPDVVGFSTLTCSGASVYQLGRWLKQKHPDVLVVLGNIHASVFADAYLDNGCCDVVVHGEGEEAFAELLEWRQGRRSVAGIGAISYVDDDGGIRRNPGWAAVDDLASLPLPARDLVDASRYRLTEISNQNFVGGEGRVGKTMITSRGCPYRCTFCVVHHGNKQRTNGVERVVDELELLEREYGASYVYIMDPLFMGDRKRVVAICDEIARRGLTIEWGCDANVNLIDDGLVRAMEAGNCVELSLGIESGVQRLLNVVGKRITLARVKRAVNTIKNSSRIKIEGLFILGLPGETWADSMETIDFATRLPLDMAQFSILCPYPGSPLFDELARAGEIDTGVRDDGTVDLDVWRRYSSYVVFTDNPPIWVTPTLSAEELRRLQKRALRRFYLRPTQIWQQAKRIRPGNVTKLARIALRGFF